MLLDFISLLLGCVSIFMLRASTQFRLTVLLGIALAALCWYVCTVYTHLWNKRFRVTLTHHILCGIASLCTLIFTVLFASVTYTQDAALASIRLWQAQLNLDRPWADGTYAKVYNRVRDLGVEDFSEAPPPGSPDTHIPTTQESSRETAASIYANEACRHFDAKRPFLGKVVWSSPGVPSQVILQDVNDWFQNNPSYPPSRAIEIAAVQVRSGLLPQVPRIIYLSRIAVVVAFLLIQAIPFSLIGWAAYRDIKVKV